MHAIRESSPKLVCDDGGDPAYHQKQFDMKRSEYEHNLRKRKGNSRRPPPVTTAASRRISTTTFLDDRTVDVTRQASFRLYIYNYTSSEIVVIDRMGLPTVYSPERTNSGYPEPVVIIRRELVYDNDEIVSRSHKALSLTGDSDCPELIQLKTLIGERHKTPSNNYGRKISIEYIIAEKDLRSSGFGIYHQKSDLVVCFSSTILPKHPQAGDFVSRSPECVTGHLSTDLTMKIRYVDYSPGATTKYLRVAGKTLSLEPNRDSPVKLGADQAGNVSTELLEKTAYIEIYSYSHDDNALVKIDRLSLDKAAALYGIYDTLAQAENIDLAHANELGAVKLSKERLQTESTAKLASRDREIELLKQNISELKVSLAKKDEDKKDALAEKAHEQKMQMERLKTNVVIGTAVLGLVPLGIKIWKELQKKQ